MENSTQQSQKSKEVFLTMVGLLGLNAEVNDKVSGRNIILSVNTDEPGRLIGRNGSSLDNVGLLMNRILKKTDNTFPKVIIDVDGYDKKPKRDKRKNNRRDKRDRRQNSDKMEKTAVMSESAEEQINVYVDDETNSLAPVTTVALESGNESNQNQRRDRRDNRRDNRRNDRRDNRRDNRRNDRRRDDRRERAPQKEAAPVSANTPPKSEPAPAPAKEQAKAAPAPAQQQSEKPAGKPQSKLQMQCRNAAKEVKRWGEDILLPPLGETDCQKALEYFDKEKDVNAKIDNSRSYGDKKRVRISLKG